MIWGEVRGRWAGCDAFVIGGGPSATGFDFTRLQRLGYVLAVKEAAILLPWADTSFGIDPSWLKRRYQALAACEGEIYQGLWSDRLEDYREIPGATWLRLDRSAGLSNDPKVIRAGLNSGYASLGLAYLKRPRRIFLVGFDMAYAGAQTHWFGTYDHAQASNARYLQRWANLFQSTVPQLAAAGIETINLSARCLITAFPKADLARAIGNLERGDPWHS